MRLVMNMRPFEDHKWINYMPFTVIRRALEQKWVCTTGE